MMQAKGKFRVRLFLCETFREGMRRRPWKHCSSTADRYRKRGWTEMPVELPSPEPSELEEIRLLRRSARHRYDLARVRAVYPQRVLSGWLARGAGVRAAHPGPSDGRALPDPQVDLLLTSLAVVERHGFTFSSDHVAGAWVDNLSEEALSGAEKTAYRSLRSGIRPPRSAELAREEGEADGAMARAFLWGYLAPGDPGFAAELAWRDARVSHAGSGVYGAMFAAAAASAAFVCDDPLEAVLVGVGEVPDTSRLAGAVGRCVRLHLAGESWEQAVRELESAWGHLPPGHAVRTAGRVALALLYGKMALAATVELAAAGAGERIPVAPGVAGAILGPMLGEPGAPEWPVRPGDTVAGGAGAVTVADLAGRTARLGRHGG